jgi:hypothetical protein
MFYVHSLEAKRSVWDREVAGAIPVAHTMHRATRQDAEAY